MIPDLNSEEILSSYPSLIDELLNLVSIPDRAYTELAWSLLTSLPTNPKLKNKLIELSEPVD